MRLQPIYDIAEVCSQKGITQAVLCPGSRCAPLTIAFSRHEKITTRTFSDERSAGFIALGMAQQHAQPVVMVCTSGSAAYNFAPSIAEAFFSQTPLLVFTADRPEEWIGQHDGQTIYQREIFGRHVKKSYQLPQEYDHPDSQWAINRMVNEAINLSMQEPCGPVHINAPFREPLYPQLNEKVSFSKDIRIINNSPVQHALSKDTIAELKNEWSQFNKILIVAGQGEFDTVLLESLTDFLNVHKIPIIGDIISNLHSIKSLVKHSDVFLAHTPEELKENLRPDLLITFGKSVISKNLKLFLRKYSPKVHWQIQSEAVVADPFQSITRVINISSSHFFDAIKPFDVSPQSNYQQRWINEEQRALQNLDSFFPQKEFGELELVNEIISNLPADSNLHLANSMSVRYANFIGLGSGQKVIVHSNRGASGIDGCNSTAVGHSLSADKPNILITGDLAFFYDRNAFWHNCAIPNLRIVVLNNHGGIIFKMIDGPASLPESEEYFVTQQKLSARKLCEEFDFDYLTINTKNEIKNTLKDFFDFNGRTKILELESSVELNKNIFESLKDKIKKSYE